MCINQSKYKISNWHQYLVFVKNICILWIDLSNLSSHQYTFTSGFLYFSFPKLSTTTTTRSTSGDETTVKSAETTTFTTIWYQVFTDVTSTVTTAIDRDDVTKMAKINKTQELSLNNNSGIYILVIFLTIYMELQLADQFDIFGIYPFN